MLNCKQFSIAREESRYGQVREEEKEGSKEEDDQEEGEEKEEEVTSNFWSTETPRKGARQRVPFRFSFCLFIFLFSFFRWIVGGGWTGRRVDVLLVGGAERPVVAVAAVKAGAGGKFLGPNAGGHIAHGIERAHGVLFRWSEADGFVRGEVVNG